MSLEIFRYTFATAVPLDEIEATLVLAILAAESLHGASQVRLDAAHAFDADHRNCVIDARSEVGRDLNRLFIGFIAREFGDSAFEVRRVYGLAKEPAGKQRSGREGGPAKEPRRDRLQGTKDRSRPAVGSSVAVIAAANCKKRSTRKSNSACSKSNTEGDE